MNRILKKLLNIKSAIVKSFAVRKDHFGKDILVVTANVVKSQSLRCPACGRKCPGYDRLKNPSRHRFTDICGMEVYVDSPSVRVRCRKHGVHVASVPWARPNSSFSTGFEDTVVWLAKNISKTAVCEYMRISWNTVGEIISRFKQNEDRNPGHRFENLKMIGIDETSYRKGHKYLTVVVNHETGNVIWVRDGMGKEVLDEFFNTLSDDQRSSIECVSADGAKWIASALEEHIPKAARCLDLFHMVEWANEALDKVRCEAYRDARKDEAEKEKRKVGRPKKGEEKPESVAAEIKGAKYALGKSPENLTPSQQERLNFIATTDRRLYRAYSLKEYLRSIIKLPYEEVEDGLKHFLWRASHSRIPAIYELQKKIRRHQEAIKNTLKWGISNARIEATNNLIKLVIRTAFGFRNMKNMLDMIMLKCSDIKADLPLR